MSVAELIHGTLSTFANETECDLKRGVEVDIFGDLQHVKLPCRGEQQCCFIFLSIRNSTLYFLCILCNKIYIIIVLLYKLFTETHCIYIRRLAALEGPSFSGPAFSTPPFVYRCIEPRGKFLKRRRLDCLRYIALALHAVAFGRKASKAYLDRRYAQSAGYCCGGGAGGVGAIGRRVAHPAAQSAVMFVEAGDQLGGDQIRRVRRDQSQNEAAVAQKVLAHEAVDVCRRRSAGWSLSRAVRCRCPVPAFHVRSSAVGPPVEHHHQTVADVDDAAGHRDGVERPARQTDGRDARDRQEPEPEEDEHHLVVKVERKRALDRVLVNVVADSSAHTSHLRSFDKARCRTFVITL